MNILATPSLYTPDDLLRLPDRVSYELVNGRLVERNLGVESSEVGGDPSDLFPAPLPTT